MLKAQILEFDRRIMAWHRSNETSRRLDAIPGIGPALATALVASVTDPKALPIGTELLSLDRARAEQHASGGKDKLGSISKQGDRYLRSTPSERRITLRNVFHSAGGLTSRSSLNIGISLISTSSHVIPLGDRAMAAFATLRLKDSRLRLPMTTATDMTIPLVPLLVYLWGLDFFPRFLLLLPALLSAMATACFCGLPAFISVLMFELIVLWEDPFLSGMFENLSSPRKPVPVNYLRN